MKESQYDPRPNTHDEEGLPREHVLIWGINAVLRRRRFIAVVTGVVAVAAVIISLLIPNEYRATARVLPPEGGGSSPLAAMLSRNLPSGAAALLGGGRTEYSRYLALLSSRSMMESVVDEFELVEVYGHSGARHSRERAINDLVERVSFDVDRAYRFLSVGVLDQSPERAADMANFLVDELNRRNASLSAQNASLFRRFVEGRYNETIAAIDSVKNVAQEFQQRHGIFDVEAQAKGFLEQTAAMRTRAIELEIEYETLLAQFGPDHPSVRAVGEAMRAANRRYQAALSGSERMMPVAQDAVPAVMREFMDIEQERVVQTRILEIVAPLYEQARFDEEREMQAVQVVDVAVPPVRKVAPKRSIIVIVATISAAMLALFFVLASTYWRERAPMVARQLAANGAERKHQERSPVA
jgi:tyrosine-protein kinase Etk/Wzc